MKGESRRLILRPVRVRNLKIPNRLRLDFGAPAWYV